MDIAPMDSTETMNMVTNCLYGMSLKACLTPAPPPSITDEKEVVLDCQSGEEFSTDWAPTDMTAANLRFVDDTTPHSYNVDAAMDATRMGEDTGEVGLGEFFARPVKIYETEWGTNLALADSFDPWTLFFSNKRVSNRITNFNLMRTKLHLKVVLNGNGFQYGRAILAYNPLDSFDSFAPTTLVDQDLTQLSQLPHLYLNPTTSQGGSMVLPFFYHLNNLNLTEGTFGDLGTCLLKSINILKHANGADDKVTISIFAWAEDITLAVPTSLDTTVLTPQSGEVDEANMTGVVSKPATAVANIAQAAATIPTIKPYAKATEMGARALASMASALGYCRPTVTKNPEPFRGFPISSLANTNVPDNALKLTVDDKQELCIDSDIAGISSGDVLDIKSIASRESFLTSFEWQVGTAPDTLLWNNRVTPVIWNESGTPTAYHFPACAMAAIPFKYWTGTMHYRFQVVASNYHKGRLRIAYDPNFFDADTEYNVNYSHVIDIAEKSDFTISVTNGQNVSLIDHHNPGPDSYTETWSKTRYTGTAPGNGVLQVTVLNELTVPNSTVNNNIEINVFVSAGEDFQVFVPDDHFQYFVLEPQSGVLSPQSGEIEGADSVPIGDEPVHSKEDVLDLNGQQIIPNQLNLVFTGEKISSFRTLLKRYNLHSTFATTSSFPETMAITMNSYPYLRGSVPGAIHSRATLDDYNFCNTVLIHWVTMAFSGWRGAIRWKFLPRNGWQFIETQAERAGILQGSQYSAVLGAPPDPVNDSQAAYGAVADSGNFPVANKPLAGKKGMVYTTDRVNPCTELECPFYSPARFVPGRVANWTTNIQPRRYNECLHLRFFTESRNGNSGYVDNYCSVGEDFQVYFFKGLPRMYYEASAPNPEGGPVASERSARVQKEPYSSVVDGVRFQ